MAILNLAMFVILQERMAEPPAGFAPHPAIYRARRAANELWTPAGRCAPSPSNGAPQ